MTGILPKRLKTQDNQSSFNQIMYTEYSTTDTVRESIGARFPDCDLKK